MQNITLAMASRAMRLKDTGTREVSERRQVGDAQDMMYPARDSTSSDGTTPWWRNVTMEEGM